MQRRRKNLVRCRPPRAGAWPHGVVRVCVCKLTKPMNLRCRDRRRKSPRPLAPNTRRRGPMFAARQTSGADLSPRPMCDAKVRCRRTVRDGGLPIQVKSLQRSAGVQPMPAACGRTAGRARDAGYGSRQRYVPCYVPLRNRPSKFRKSTRRRCPRDPRFRDREKLVRPLCAGGAESRCRGAPRRSQPRPRMAR